MLETILSYVVPLVAVGLSYIFGKMQATASEKSKAEREAYETFYLPFITLLYQTRIWNIGFAYLGLKERCQLFKLVVENIKYMDKETLEYIDILYVHYGAILGKELLDVDSVFTHERANEIFDGLTEKVLCRATWLAKRLHQPCIGEFVLELYCEMTEDREKQRTEVVRYNAHN
ncbi:MAG: hypothetical protein RR423_08980 [Hydrogenoanaerobacterium sp.]